MAKRYTAISVPYRTQARWQMMKREMYGDLANEVSQERMMEDILDIVREEEL